MIMNLHLRVTYIGMKNYVVCMFHSLQVVSSPAPTSGPQLLAFLNAMDDYRSRYGVTPIDAEYLRNITQVFFFPEIQAPSGGGGGGNRD